MNTVFQSLIPNKQASLATFAWGKLLIVGMIWYWLN